MKTPAFSDFAFTTTFSGDFASLTNAFGPSRRRVTIIFESIALFGMSFYAKRYSFMAETTYHNDGSVDFRPTDPPTIERSEWWRAAVFYLFKYPAALVRAMRLVRR